MDKIKPDIFEPDRYHLDEELVNQPRYYFEFAERLADARRDHERAEANKDLTYAELDQKMRANPEVFGIEKVTEGSVKQAITVHKKYQSAVATAIDAKHDMDVLQGAVTALDHRKRALEKLCELFLANYFANPRINGDSRTKMEEDGKRAARTGGRNRDND